MSKIEADRLRNLKAVHLDLPGGMTVVLGCNGQGKTTLLEAVYLLGTGRSFRTRRHDELISHDGGPLRVAGEVEGRQGRSGLGVAVQDGERRLLVDGGEVELDAFLGRLDVVDLTSRRMEVLRGPPVERRRFLDRGVVGLQPSYLRSLGLYRRVLQQRNALLREGSGREAELEAWDARLVESAMELHRSRRVYTSRLAAGLAETARVLFGDGELTLQYRPSPSASGEAAMTEFPRIYEEALARGRERDRAVGHTCTGPHRDELEVALEGADLRRFGSAGQLRGAMIALKLGKISLLQRDRGEVPVFLMDDFDTDLDERRAAALAVHLDQGRFQVLAATSKQKMAGRLGVSFMTVHMEGGEARTA